MEGDDSDCGKWTSARGTPIPERMKMDRCIPADFIKIGENTICNAAKRYYIFSSSLSPCGKEWGYRRQSKVTRVHVKSIFQHKSARKRQMKADIAVAGGMHPLDASCLHSLSGIGVPWADCSRVRLFLYWIYEYEEKIHRDGNTRAWSGFSLYGEDPLFIRITLSLDPKTEQHIGALPCW